jgi:hypothetical protein
MKDAGRGFSMENQAAVGVPLETTRGRGRRARFLSAPADADAARGAAGAAAFRETGDGCTAFAGFLTAGLGRAAAFGFADTGFATFGAGRFAGFAFDAGLALAFGAGFALAFGADFCLLFGFGNTAFVFVTGFLTEGFAAFRGASFFFGGELFFAFFAALVTELRHVATAFFPLALAIADHPGMHP